jgi:hypothetical protein
MLLQAVPQGRPRPVQAHHRVVRRETKLRGDLAHRNAIDDHATENARLLRLELFGLRQNAPAINLTCVIDEGNVELADG